MADNTVNTVVLSVSSYSQIKNENFKYSLFLDNIFQAALLSKDHQSLVFDTDAVEAAVKFCFGEMYKRKLATLKTCFARYGTNYEIKEDTKDEVAE